MPVLASFTDQSDFQSDAIAIPADGPVQLFVRGALGARGGVQLLLKGDDDLFHGYPELSVYSRPAAIEVNLLAGDEVKLRFVRCAAASAEVRQ